MGIAEKFNTKIHIANWKMNAYADLPAVRGCLTSEGNTTRIHSCVYKVSWWSPGVAGLIRGSPL